jgi:hypothetical protein
VDIVAPENKGLAERFRIGESYPDVKLLKSGKIVREFSGKCKSF